MCDIWSCGTEKSSAALFAFAEVYEVIFSADSRPFAPHPAATNAAVLTASKSVRGEFLFMANSLCLRPHAIAPGRACTKQVAAGKPIACRDSCVQHRENRASSQPPVCRRIH